MLVTGFEANDPLHRNASAVLVGTLAERLQELRRASGGAEVRTRIMPGDTMALSASLEAALDEQPWPTHLLLLGQAPGRNGVTLERIATNHAISARQTGMATCLVTCRLHMEGQPPFIRLGPSRGG